jgi:hypothetical protein
MQECMAGCKEQELLRRDAGPEEEHAGATLESLTWNGEADDEWGEHFIGRLPVLVQIRFAALCR